MKKIFLVLIITLIVTGCLEKNKTYEEINYSKLIDKFEKKENFVLFIGSTSCPHCDLYKETLNKIIKKYQIKVYYIDVSKLSSKETNKLKLQVNYNGTPTTSFIEQGQEKSMYDRIEGNQSYNKVIEKMKKKGYIK